MMNGRFDRIALAAAVGLFAGLGSVTVLEAQQGQITGSVTDTLNRRRLAGARVMIEGITREFVTDSSGRFTADSIPLGTYRVSFRHPVLDTLAMRSAVVTVTVTAGTPARAALGVPSGRSFMRLCAAPLTPRSRGAIFGLVRNAETDEPLVGTDIRVSWDDIVVDPTLGVRRKVQLRNATTDSVGRYLVCDLPTDVTVSVLGTEAGYLSASGEAAMRTEEAVPLHFSLAPEGAPRSATLSGRVIDVERKPLQDADIWVVTGQAGETSVARTDANGNFTLGNLRPGTGMVAVRRIGSAMTRRTISLAAGRTTPIQIMMARQIATLPELTVKAKAGRAEQAGFNERKAQGFGKFYDKEAIERMAAVSTGDVFRQLPFLRLDPGNFGTMLTNQNPGRSTTGQACAMALLVDGMQTPPDALFGMSKTEIDGLEVYDRPERVPIQYQSPATSCGAIMVWTKR